MSFLPPTTPGDVGLMVALGFVEGSASPPPSLIFDADLAYPATSAEGFQIATVTNPIVGETYGISPDDGKVKWVGNQLQVGPTSTASGPASATYTLTRTAGGKTLSEAFAFYIEAAPVAPGAQDRLVNADNGLSAFSTTYNSTTGNVFVSIFGQTKTGAPPNLSATWNGVAMTKATEAYDPVPGGAVVAFFGIPGGATGSRTLAVSSAIDVGVGGIRIADLASVNANWVGAVQGNTGRDNYADVSITPQAGGASLLRGIAGWAQPGAGGVSFYGDLTQQWYGEALVEGPDLIVNGDFASAAGWTLGAPFTISGGKLNKAASAGGTYYALRPATLKEGALYKHTFTIDSTASASFAAYAANGLAGGGPYRNSAGTYATNFYSYATGAQNVGVMSLGTGVAVVDNVSLKEQLGSSFGFYVGPSRPGSGFQFTWEPGEGRVGSYAAIVVEILGGVLP